MEYIIYVDIFVFLTNRPPRFYLVHSINEVKHYALKLENLSKKLRAVHSNRFNYVSEA